MNPKEQLRETIRRGERIVVVDLFCGAGGMSWGLANALESIATEFDRPIEDFVRLIAVNHWERAIETHKANHPWAEHYQCSVQSLNPRELVDEETVQLLIACPDCTYFSPARGGGPKDPDSRMTPREVLDWVERLPVQNLLFENVPSFEHWGPLDENNEVIEEQKGEFFEHWINALTISGFAVDWTILNAADYGDATSRERLFVAGRKHSGVDWPSPSHSQDGEVEGTEPWRTAADVIDWSDLGDSLWSRDLEDGRRKPLVNNTMQRIAEGIRRHGHDRLEPFADAVGQIGRDDVYRMRDLAVPARDAATVADAVSEPFLVRYQSSSSESAEDEEQSYSLCVPYLLRQQSGGTPPSVDTPVPTVATRGAISMVDPRTFVLPKNGKQRGLFSNRAYSAADRPLHTVVAGRIDQGYTVTPYLVPFYNERDGQRPRVHDVDDPHPTVVASKVPAGICRPYLVEYYGNGSAQPVDAPMPTVTTKDRFALVVPECYPLGLDIKFRMLKPSELAAAQGFPPEYEFAGNKGETVEQIGNAVPVNLAQALCERMLVGRQPTIDSYGDRIPGGVEADD